MKSETGPEQSETSVRCVTSPLDRALQSRRPTQVSPPRQATACRTCASTALQAVCVDLAEIRALC
eukprot:4164393-Prymnesium_polylepis.1